MKHLSIRVAWHENQWNGTICNHPSENTYCIHLPRINEDKNDGAEEAFAGKHWKELHQMQIPPCKAEGGSFMSEKPYKRVFNHPYYKPNGKDIPHNNLLPTEIDVAPYTSFAVPFWWMLKGNQEEITESYPDIPQDEKAPFNSPWVYGREKQFKLLKTFFEPIKPGRSVALYYVKGMNPVDEESRRLIVGIGTIIQKSDILEYKSKANYTYPIWDRAITHGIRKNEPNSQGVFIPYHDYLALPEDFSFKTKDGYKNKYDLIEEIKLTLDETGGRKDIIGEFTYGSEHVNDRTLLALLARLRVIVENVKEHGIVRGHWDNALIWIDKKIGEVKEAMGPFPSFGNALLSYGFYFGNILESDLREQRIIGAKDNPWDAWEDILYGHKKIKNCSYISELNEYAEIWLNENKDRKELLKLLSRFDLEVTQIENWFVNAKRAIKGYKFTDKEIIENPYLIVEADKGDEDNYPISVETIDNGVFEDKAIQGEHVPELPSRVNSSIDRRRIRALIITILKESADNGDTLLSTNEVIDSLNALKLDRITKVPDNYLNAQSVFLKEKLEYLSSDNSNAVQLKEYFSIEESLRKILIARASKNLPALTEDWSSLIKRVIREQGVIFDETNHRHIQALEDQVNALNKVTSRKLSVLHGPAGTGKTTVMGAVFASATLQAEGILLLAPTGKARVRLGNMANNEAFTIAQFLSKHNRFDWIAMRPKLVGKEKYAGEKNVIIDECSMLTIEDLFAVIDTLDLSVVKRIILVGDPYQLPPIGPGRPFADFCAFVESIDVNSPNYGIKDALARLGVVVRTKNGEDSDALTLASWYSGQKPLKNADIVFNKIGDNTQLNDLRIECWQSEEDLLKKINLVLHEELGFEDPEDYESLNATMGIIFNPNTQVTIDPSKIEYTQVLTPVKGPYWGAFNLNRHFQNTFRKGIKDKVKVGDYEIKTFDKVIQTVNQRLEGFPSKIKHQISNGQLGIVKRIANGYANVVFAGMTNADTIGYKSQNEDDESIPNIELAYAITVHKSQGSDFDLVFLIVPKTGRINSRELIYTGLTRAKKKLILLIEGDNPHWIMNLSKPQYSETAKRNTHLFSYAVRDNKLSIPFVEGLIHKTIVDGLFVRSKSEVIIANLLYERGIPFEYERQIIAENNSKRIPDFTFIDASGEVIIWEHLGLMHQPAYAEEWNKKLDFYHANGFVLNQNLFATRDEANGAINSDIILDTINKIAALL